MRGGGEILYLHKEIESSEIALHSSSIEFEYVCCKLHLTNSKFFGILCLYRPPNISSTGDLALTNLITEFLDLKLSYNVIFGDFNMPSINWKTFSGPARYLPFLNCCTEQYITQHVQKSTRPDSNTLLDLIFSTQGTVISEVNMGECFGTSDHSMINFTID